MRIEPEKRKALEAEGIRVDATREETNYFQTKSIAFVKLSDVVPEEVEWLWAPYIPLGKITLLEGDPAAGKTWLALALATAISRGAALPNEDGRCIGRREPGSIIIVSAEDGAGDTLRPRLDGLGADVTRIYAITGTQENEKEGAFSFEDLDLLDGLADGLKPSLIVIDPLQAFLGAAIDMHRANETRPVLARLATLAAKHRCAMLLIRHLSKGIASKSIYRGLGSIDFTAAARSALLAGVNPQNPMERALVHIKSNLMPAGPSQGYELRDGFSWTGISNLTAGQLLSNETFEKRDKLEDASKWLTEQLEDGPRLKKDIEAMAEQEDIKPMTLRRAFEKLKVKSYKNPGEKNGPYVWELPGNKCQSRVVQGDDEVKHPLGQNMSNPSTRDFPSNDAASTGCSRKNDEQTVEVNGDKASSVFHGLFKEIPLDEQPVKDNEQPVKDNTVFSKAVSPDGREIYFDDTQIPF